MFNFTRWQATFADQVSKLREQRTGRVTLLHDAEVESVPGMEQALLDCYRELVKPKDAARRYVALVEGLEQTKTLYQVVWVSPGGNEFPVREPHETRESAAWHMELCERRYAGEPGFYWANERSL